MKLSKNYKKALELVDSSKVYSIEEACELVKKTSTVKFDATVDVSIRFNVDTTKADQQIRGTLILPHGNGKNVRICAITSKVEDAKAAGGILPEVRNYLKRSKKKTGLTLMSSLLPQI